MRTDEVNSYVEVVSYELKNYVLHNKKINYQLPFY